MLETTFKGKDEFIRRKKGVRSEADITAQRLINIYRQLSVLGNEAAQRYNQQLIRDANPEVLASFKTLPGGDEVHDYYDFLTHTDTEGSDGTLSTESDSLSALLPSAEQLSPLWANYGMQGQQTPIKTVVQTSGGEPLAVSVLSRDGGAAFSSGDNASYSSASETKMRGVDTDKLEQALLDMSEKQKESIKHIFECIVIDSNIEKMHTNLKNAINEVMSQLESDKEKLPEVLEKLKTTYVANDLPEGTVSSPQKKKSQSNASYKSFRKKSEHKFSVDMTDDEE